MARKKGIPNSTYHFWTDEEKLYLKEIVKNKTTKEIQKLMIEKFDYNFSHNQIAAAMKRYKIKSGYKNFYEGMNAWNKGKKGFMGPNKTSWKQGRLPHNYKKVGSERLIEGYIHIKVADPNIWMLKQRYMYEKYHNCKLKKDETIIFADKNKLNFNEDNLIKVTRNQLRVMNQYRLVQDDQELTKIGINIANILIKTYELKKQGDR